MNISRNKIVIFLLLLFILLGILLITNIVSNKKNGTNTKINSLAISPTGISSQDKSEINPIYKKGAFIPTYIPERGKGVDLGSPLTATSMQEIQKLYPYLPYEGVIKTPQNQEVDVVIANKTSQPNTWTLQVNIFGLDYTLVKGNPGYDTMKNSFIYAVSALNAWIKEKGADPKKIMIIWGNTQLIQDKSQEWLE